MADRDPQTVPDRDAAPAATRTALLEADGLECVRGEQVLFSGLSFALATGSILQIEGPNGAGKTSLLRICCGLSLPETGEVRWRGERILANRADYLAELAYVGHLHGVKGELTPIENLRLAAALCHRSTGMAPERALERAGLAARADVLCRNLSAGQRRRVALARLLMMRALVWVLDEPVTAVDQRGVADIETLIVEHVGQGGLVLLTSHQALQFPGCDVGRIYLGS